jgi:hypothetical protein
MMGLPRSVTHALEAITLQPATLQVDAVLMLVGAGGNLGERALDQAPFWKVSCH